MKTPIAQLIHFIENIGITKEVSDETKDALTQLADHITNEAKQLLHVEQTIIFDAYNDGAEDSGEVTKTNYGEVYYNETFEPLPIEPVIMDEVQFQKYIKEQENQPEQKV